MSVLCRWKKKMIGCEFKVNPTMVELNHVIFIDQDVVSKQVVHYIFDVAKNTGWNKYGPYIQVIY